MQRSPGALSLALASLVALACAPVRSQDTAWTFQPPRDNFVAASYDGRDFLDPSNHLGEDSAHLHHDEVHAIAAGIVRYADVASGYGRVVVVEHRLPDGSFVSSIYGHLCSHAGYPLVPEGSLVQAGDRVGFVGEDAENGDGREHIHLGIRKGAYDGFFCGYSREPECPSSRYHRPSEFIAQRSGRLRVLSGVDLGKTALRPGAPATFAALVRNDHFDPGAFELRLRLQRGDEPPSYGPVVTKSIKPGDSERLEVLQLLGPAGTYQAAFEVRLPGVAGWSAVEALAPGVNPRTFTVGTVADACASPPALPARGGVATGRTSGAGTKGGSCGGGGAPEAVYRWTPKTSGPVTVSTCGSAFDTLLYVRAASCTDGLEVACNDDSRPCRKGGSQLTFNATAGMTYFLLVDGGANASGPFRLTVKR